MVITDKIISEIIKAIRVIEAVKLPYKTPYSDVFTSLKCESLSILKKYGSLSVGGV